MFDLHGKTALVTGSNRGIGRSILLAFAEYGADVILHCRKPNERAEQVIEQAKSYGVNCYAVYTDLSEPNGPERLYQKIKAAMTGLQLRTRSLISRLTPTSAHR